MNVLSLFAGIGGLDLGLERAGMTVVGQVEIDPFCQKVLAKHWPEVPRHDDVRTCVDWWLGEPRPAVDVVAGGFPCQPVSVAGKQRAQADERWLWPAFAAVIRDLRPRYAIMENVPGLLGRGMGDVLGDLAEIGYDAGWDCVPAAAVGANHRRDRVFVVAYPRSESGGLQPEPEPRRGATSIAGHDGPNGHVAHPEGGRWRAGRPRRPAGDGPDRAVLTSARLVADTDRAPRGREAWPAESGACLGAVRERPTEPRRCGSDVAHPDGPGQPQPSRSVGQERGRIGDGGQPTAVADPHGSRREPWGGLGRSWPAPVRDSWWTTEPDVGRVAHGVPGRVDRLRALGNAVVPQVAEHIGRLVMGAT